MANFFCACCGTSMPEWADQDWPICDLCQPHCLKRHPELSWWRAVYVPAQKDANGIPICPIEKAS